MDIVIGILLLITYFGMVFISVKGKNLTTLFFLMTILWGVLAIIGGALTFNDFLSKVISAAATDYGGVIILILVGSIFGAILVETNIAGSIVRKTAELGGTKVWLTMFLLSIATSLICMSVYGLGIVMAIGVIIIPILLSIGVNKKVAVASFVMSISAGAFLNPMLTSFLTVLFEGFDITSATYRTYAFIAYGVSMLATLSMSLVMHKRTKTVHAWAAVNDQAADEKKMVHWYAMITPIIPVVLFFFFKWDVIPAMLIAMFYALLSTGYFKNLKNMEETIYRCTKESISDSALLIAFLLTAAMFATVARTSAPFFQSVLGNVIPSNPLVLVIGLAVFAPLALYRGPLTAYGCGLAIVAIVIGSGYFDNQYVYMLFANTSMAITLMACPTQSWTQWTLNYANSSSTDHVKTALPWVWVMAAVNMFIAYIMFA